MRFDGLKHEEDLREIQPPKLALAQLFRHELIYNLVELDVFLDGRCGGSVILLKAPILRFDGVRRDSDGEKIIGRQRCARERRADGDMCASAIGGVCAVRRLFCRDTT